MRAILLVLRPVIARQVVRRLRIVMVVGLILVVSLIILRLMMLTRLVMLRFNLTVGT